MSKELEKMKKETFKSVIDGYDDVTYIVSPVTGLRYEEGTPFEVMKALDFSYTRAHPTRIYLADEDGIDFVSQELDLHGQIVEYMTVHGVPVPGIKGPGKSPYLYAIDTKLVHRVVADNVLETYVSPVYRLPRLTAIIVQGEIEVYVENESEASHYFSSIDSFEEWLAYVHN